MIKNAKYLCISDSIFNNMFQLDQQYVTRTDLTKNYNFFLVKSHENSNEKKSTKAIIKPDVVDAFYVGHSSVLSSAL